MKIEASTLRNILIYPRSLLRAYRVISNEKFSEYIAGRRKLLWMRVAKENLYFRGSNGCQLGHIFVKNYEKVDKYFTEEALNRLINGNGLVLLKLNNIVEIYLSAARHNDKEAEFYLKIYREDVLIYTLGFVVVDADTIYPGNNIGILITRLQGVRAHKNAIDVTIKEFGDVSLDRALISVISGICNFMNIKVIHAISHKLQVYYRNEFNGVFSNTYDGFWETYGADLESDFYSINLPYKEKPLEDVKANHRSRTVRKRNIQKSITNFVSGRLHEVTKGLHSEANIILKR